MITIVKGNESGADISDAAGTDQYLFNAPFNGKVLVDKCYVRWAEATGTQTSAQGTINLLVAGTTVGTMTASQSAAVGSTNGFAVDGTNATATDPWYPFSAGDAILCEIGTQASGGTVTGDGEIYLAVAYDSGA